MSYEHAAQAARCKVILFALISVLTLVGGCSTVAPAAAGPRGRRIGQVRLQQVLDCQIFIA
jgi:hypothetical protein